MSGCQGEYVTLSGLPMMTDEGTMLPLPYASFMR